MALWSIGPIRGQYQPESFVESQKSKYEDIEIFGNVSLVLFKGWDPREVTLSFVVDGMCDPDDNFQKWSRQGVHQAGGGPGPRASDPEAVWAEIQRMQRFDGAAPIPIRVNIPGWGGRGRSGDSAGEGRRQPATAFISESTINRTHIRGVPSRAVRAIISVTLREANELLGRPTDPNSLTRAETARAQQEDALTKAQDAGATAAGRLSFP